MNDLEKLFDKTLRFLSFRPRSEKEIRDYLLKKKADTKTIEKIISELKELRFVNDSEFVKWWVEQRTKIKPRSLRLIKIELKQKGIPQDLLEEINLDSQDDLESARLLVKKKINKYKDLPKLEIYQKLGRFLASKGFNWDTIKKSIDEEFGKRV